MAGGILIVAKHTEALGTRVFTLSADTWMPHEFQMEMLGLTPSGKDTRVAVNEVLAYYPHLDGGIDSDCEKLSAIRDYYQKQFDKMEPYYGQA